MQDKVATSWRRRSDPSPDSDDERVGEKSASSMRADADKLDAWEDEGGRTGSASSEVTTCSPSGAISRGLASGRTVDWPR
jgi:hypothetical protein